MACVPAYRGSSLEGIGKQASHADFPTPFQLSYIAKRYRTAVFGLSSTHRIARNSHPTKKSLNCGILPSYHSFQTDPQAEFIRCPHKNDFKISVIHFFEIFTESLRYFIQTSFPEFTEFREIVDQRNVQSYWAMPSCPKFCNMSDVCPTSRASAAI